METKVTAMQTTITGQSDFKGLRQLLEGEKSVFLVYDRNVEAYAREVIADIPEDIYKGAYVIDATEDNKNITTVIGITRWLLDANADRGALVLNLGGGVTTDMGGFAACIYKRGIRYANIPTTLLAQVDAAIGGKTGVNLDSYKNELGVISQPQFVYINPQTLDTLDQTQVKSGQAELLKTFIIDSGTTSSDSAGNYSKAVNSISKGTEDWKSLVAAAAAVKYRIITEDPYERGLRRVLNLGHTFGHAIEWAQHTIDRDDTRPLSHGEAVAVGMVIAAQISEKLGVCQPGLAQSLADDFKACGLPTTSPVAIADLRTALSKDKKVEGDLINFVLVESVGKVLTRKLSIKEIYDLLVPAR